MDNKFSTIKERCLELAKIKGFSKEEFCSKIGMTYGNFKGIAKKTPLNSNAIENILSLIPDVNLIWLLTGTGPMLREQGAPEPVQHAPDSEKESPVDGYLLLIREMQAKIEAQAIEIGRLRGRISLINSYIKMRGGDFTNPIFGQDSGSDQTPRAPISPGL